MFHFDNLECKAKRSDRRVARINERFEGATERNIVLLLGRIQNIKRKYAGSTVGEGRRQFRRALAENR